MSKPKEGFTTLDISNTHLDIKNDLDNIVSNLGITKSKFLREVYLDLIKKTPQHKKEPLYNCEKMNGLLRVDRVTDEMKETLRVIAQNNGQDLIPFLRSHLYMVVQNYPEKYKQPLPDF